MKKLLRRTATVLAVLVTAIALFYAIEDFRGARAWRAERERLEAAGEVLNWADLGSKSRPRSTGLDPVNWQDEELFGVPGFKPYFLPRDLMNPATGGVLLQQWRRLLITPPSGAVGSETDCEAGRSFLTATSSLDPAVAALVVAARVGPIAQWPLDLNLPPASVKVPPLIKLRTLMNLLRIRIAAHVACGQPAQAIDEMRVIAREEESLRDLPFMVTYLIGAALEDGLVSAIQDALSRGGLSAVQRQEAGALLRPDWFAGARYGLQAERDSLIYYAETPMPFSPAKEPVTLMPRGWLLRQAIHLSAFTEKATHLLADPEHIDPRAVDALSPPGTSLRQGATPYSIIARMSEPGVVRVIKTAAALQTRIRLVRTAFAVVSYRERTGSLPADLAALVPDELGDVPMEIVLRDPLRYRPTPSGFIVYSVGWDLADDGGVTAGIPATDQRDWVLAIENPETGRVGTRKPG